MNKNMPGKTTLISYSFLLLSPLSLVRYFEDSLDWFFIGRGGYYAISDRYIFSILANIFVGRLLFS